jgi:hypothetical protein
MCRIEAPDGNIIAEIPLQHGLYALGARNLKSDVALSATQKLTLLQAHKVLGHIHYRAIQCLTGQWVIPVNGSNPKISTSFAPRSIKKLEHTRMNSTQVSFIH